MINSILKSIVMGLLAGATIFFMPKFLVSAIILLIVIKLLFGKGRKHMMYHHRFGRHRFGEQRFAFADKIRSMNEDEYLEFKNRFGNRDCNNFGRNRESKNRTDN